MRDAQLPPVVVGQRFGDDVRATASLAGGSVGANPLAILTQPLTIVRLADGPPSHLRQLGLGPVGVTHFDVNGLPLEAADRLVELVFGQTRHYSPCVKSGIILSGISTHVSPSGIRIAARASGSATTQP